jgi:hypothetical protein
MIHGIQKIELTYQSVQEALTDYLQKHLTVGVTVKDLAWTASVTYAGGVPSCSATFIQAEAQEKTDG